MGNPSLHERTLIQNTEHHHEETQLILMELLRLYLKSSFYVCNNMLYEQRH